MSWRMVWEVDGERRLDFVGSWTRCWRLVQLFARIPGPGIVWLGAA